MIEPRRTPIKINRKGKKMRNPFHNPEPTTNVASRERAGTRQVKKDIRIDDTKTVRNVRDKREGDDKDDR